jgi:hypothetical protein
MNWFSNISFSFWNVIVNGNTSLPPKDVKMSLLANSEEFGNIFGKTNFGRSKITADGQMTLGERSFSKLEIDTNKNFPVIKFVGTCTNISSTSGNISITGDSNNASSTSGDIRIEGNVTGSANSVSGNIRAGKINGQKKTVSGSMR